MSRPSEPAHGSDGVSILPIPPALDFPYPRQSTESSVPASLSNAEGHASPLPNGSKTPSAMGPPKIGLDEQSSDPLPRRSLAVKERTLTERIPERRSGSTSRLRRRQTGAPMATFNPTLWNSESDFSSSSSDEDETRYGGVKKTSSFPRSGSQNEKTRHLAGRLSDDPYSRFSIGNDDYKTKGHVSKRDGRLKISVKETANRGYLAKALGATLRHHMGGQEHDETSPVSPAHETTAAEQPDLTRTDTASTLSTIASYDGPAPPKLNIVIMVIGSRGDIQPFLRLGKILKEQHGHRVRIATHPAFKEFVEKDSELEFFSVGGNPAELMAFMVKNPGLIPKAATIRAGEIAKRRDSMFEMFQGFWRACINETDDETDIANLKMMGRKNPFVADAIIANPPSFAHIHCAECLGIPFHLMFTFPTSPTQQFPHPLTKIKQSNVDANYTNFMSYPLVEMMTWQGLGDLVNRFRVKTLGLEPVSTLWAPGQLFRLRVPHTYLWSPGLIPKPKDWGPEISVTGFVFLDLASSFKPPDALTKFLDAGEPPVYIGFGSIVVDDPDKFTKLIFEAVQKAGIRALVSKGWGGLGDDDNTPDNIYMLDNTPHDWLFPRVSAVVHHGGAGSTAIGLKCGKPTMIVPFFGDQPFWGAMVAKAGAGAEPVPYKHLTAEILAESIKTLLTTEVQEAAKTMAKQIEAEGDGAINAVASFHESLPLSGNHSMRCSVFQERSAVWWLKNMHIRLSALAAEILVLHRKIRWQDLYLIRHYDWNDFEGPGEPFTGGGAAIVNSVGAAVHGIGRTPFRWMRTVKKQTETATDDEKTSNKREKAQKEQKGRDSKDTSQVDRSNKEKSRETSPSKDSKNAEDKPGEHLLPSSQTPGKPIVGKEGESNDPLSNGSSRKTSSGRNEDHDDDNSSDKSEENMAQDLAADTKAGIAKTSGAIAKAPMDLALAVAQGFHNAPRLYGDSTVRTPTRITGVKSGVIAASREFCYGVYDGWTGLVKQPIQGAKEDGAIGFAKGIGKGIGGWVLKDMAAIAGIPAYTMKGIHKEITKSRQPTNFVRRSHMVAGQKDLAELSDEDAKEAKKAVMEGWQTILSIEHDIESTKEKGVQGRYQVYKDKRKWKKYGLFENVELAGQALDAQREGRNFRVEFAHLRKHAKRSLGSHQDKDKIKAKSEKRKMKEEEAKEKKEKETSTEQSKNEKPTTASESDSKRSVEMANVASGTDVADQNPNSNVTPGMPTEDVITSPNTNKPDGTTSHTG